MQPGHSMAPASNSSTPAPKDSAQQNMQKWEADEPQGENATIAMILYANINHTNLKMEHPKWEDRIKQIAKIWKNLPNEKRVPYVTKARENRTANRSRGPVSIIALYVTTSLCSVNISIEINHRLFLVYLNYDKQT